MWEVRQETRGSIQTLQFFYYIDIFLTTQTYHNTVYITYYCFNNNHNSNFNSLIPHIILNTH